MLQVVEEILSYVCSILSCTQYGSELQDTGLLIAQ